MLNKGADIIDGVDGLDDVDGVDGADGADGADGVEVITLDGVEGAHPATLFRVAHPSQKCGGRRRSNVGNNVI